LIVGEKETKKDLVSVRARGAEDLGVMSIESFSSILSKDIEGKK
jgi:threonyl-tRNA synthetase